jgi:hypothetical protein
MLFITIFYLESYFIILIGLLCFTSDIEHFEPCHFCSKASLLAIILHCCICRCIILAIHPSISIASSTWLSIPYFHSMATAFLSRSMGLREGGSTMLGQLFIAFACCLTTHSIITCWFLWHPHPVVHYQNPQFGCFSIDLTSTKHVLPLFPNWNQVDRIYLSAL